MLSAISSGCYLCPVHHVKGHYRNGRWVRPHYRRSRGSASPHPGGVRTRVRRHQRSDGAWVRSHYRERPATTMETNGAGGIGFAVGGLLLFVLLLVILTS